MIFTKTETTDDDGRYIAFTPKDHPWCKSVIINESFEDPDFNNVQIHMKEPTTPSEKQLINNKHSELCGLRDLFDRKLDKNFIEVTFDPLDDEDTSNIVFSVGPTSKIKSILTQSNLPADLREAVMQELQQIWARTPGS